MDIQGIHSESTQQVAHSAQPMTTVPLKAETTDTEPERAAEICIASTDRVDGEIARLKSMKAQLSRQVGGLSDEALKKKLAQVEDELRQKDNDTYRRQNTEFSSGVDIQA